MTKWFLNNCKVAGLEKYGHLKTWNIRSVVASLRKQEIRDRIAKKTDDEPGGQNYLMHYQTALTETVDSLSSKDREMYNKKANKWANNGPNAQEQSE